MCCAGEPMPHELTSALFVPGPVPVSRATRAALGAAMTYHRDAEYGAALRDVTNDLRRLLGCSGDVLVMTAAGTGALEAAFTNLCDVGDRVVVASNGYFGERLVEHVRALGMEVEHVDGAWEQDLRLADVERALRRGARCVAAVQLETSTGAINDIAGLAHIASDRGALVLVDAIASAGAIPVDVDRNQIDVAVASSQKGVGGAPGLAINAVSPRAWSEKRARRGRTFYFDWDRMLASLRRDPPESLWTPPISTMIGLRAALRGNLAESPDALLARRRRLAGALRAGLGVLGLRPYEGSDERSPILVARPPAGIGSARLVSAASARGLVIAGGQGRLAGHVVRMAALGEQTPGDVVDAVERLGRALADLGGRRATRAAADAAAAEIARLAG